MIVFSFAIEHEEQTFSILKIGSLLFAPLLDSVSFVGSWDIGTKMVHFMFCLIHKLYDKAHFAQFLGCGTLVDETSYQVTFDVSEFAFVVVSLFLF